MCTVPSLVDFPAREPQCDITAGQAVNSTADPIAVLNGTLSSADQCCSLCTQTSMCVAWSWYDMGRLCELYDDSGTLTQFMYNGAFSGSPGMCVCGCVVWVCVVCVVCVVC